MIALAPDHATAWNRRRMDVYEEPTDLVDATLRRLRWGTHELAAIERQRTRFHGGSSVLVGVPMQQEAAPARQCHLKPFPKGPFRFVALDVETATHDRGSICQIGVACVRPDNSVETWMTYVDPQVDRWVFTSLHGISARTVRGAPTFAEVLPLLRDALRGQTVYQHSGFDRSAVAAACGNADLPVPEWEWRDSVYVARRAWPELRGKGGHGLASLKRHLGLVFQHHDAGEDARAAAEVVLRAEGWRSPVEQEAPRSRHPSIDHGEDLDLIDDDDPLPVILAPVAQKNLPMPLVCPSPSRTIGVTEITSANIEHSHIYLRNFFERFPEDAIGGSNRASVARREIAINWGGGAAVMTDLDGKKRFFRKRGWVRSFFERNGARAGDLVLVEEIGPYRYRVILQPRPA
ncbi:exonuclease domain-containing protein [Paracoccus shandongensis]|uniref:exonuclease domain-containing protein n=1 Tax=Paracoccus shandongensis TaxID=2816048 RepID=UPI0030132BA9